MPVRGERESLPISIRNLWTLFEASVLREQNSIALTDVGTGETLTFRGLESRVNQLARFLLNALRRCGPNANADSDRVIGVCLPPSIDLIVCLFAVLRVKAAYLPLDVDFPSSRVNHILEDAKPQLLLIKGYQPSVVHLKSSSIDGVSVVDLNEEALQIKLESCDILTHESMDVSSSDLLLAILYTSGSTGTPKGVRIPQSAVLNRLIWQWRTFPYEANEVCCFKTALTFVDSISEIFGSLLTGHHLAIIPKSLTRDVERLMTTLEGLRVGRLVLVPSLLRSIVLAASRAKDSLPRLRLWICSGEIFPPDLIYAFFDVFKNGQTICNFYGSTEVMGDVSFAWFRNIDDVIALSATSKIPIGKPISNSDVYLLDKCLEEVSDGMVGELFIAGLNLAKGYVGRPHCKAFIPNPHSSKPGYDVLYKTGDFARYLNGQLVYEGRTDSQLKVRGHRVDLSEVESALQGTRGVEKCHVVCFRPGEIDQAILAFYVTKDEDITGEFLIDHLSSLLPVYMHPQFVKIDEMPVLVNGKVDRQRLLKIYEDLGFRKTLQEAAFDLSQCEEGKEDMAFALLKSLSRVLGPSAPSNMSLGDNFFKIGGNSLNAVLALTSFQDSGYFVSIRDFLKAKTLNDILMKTTKVEDMPFSQDPPNAPHVEADQANEYLCFPLKDENKEVVNRILTASFVSKGDLERLVNITESEFSNSLQLNWEPILNQDLSFTVYRKGEDEIIAVAINTDLFAEPEMHLPTKNLKYVYDFLEECEAKVRYCLPEGVGKVVHSVLMATKEDVQANENVDLIKVMEEENFNVARRKGYEAIFTTNTSDLTQHICEDLFSYKVLGTFQVNKWVAEDGKRPFQKAPDSQVAVCSVCYVTDQVDDVIGSGN